MHEDSVTSPLMKSGRIAISEKEIFDYICSNVYVSELRKRYALRYHMNRFLAFGITSEMKLKEIYNIWGFDSIENKTLGDKIYNRINVYLRKHSNTFLSF